MAIKAVLLDLDGTILDTLEDLVISVNHALKECGYPERTYAEIRRFVGNGAKKLIARSVPEGTGEEECGTVLKKFNEHYSVHCEDHTGPYKGIPELIVELKNRGMGIAVVSNKPDYAVQTLCANHFPGLIEVTAGQKSGVRMKPEPDSVYMAIEDMGAVKEEAVYVGDSEVDIKTAENAGIPCILVDWGFRDREDLEAAGGKIIVSSVPELEDVLFKMAQE